MVRFVAGQAVETVVERTGAARAARSGSRDAAPRAATTDAEPARPRLPARRCSAGARSTCSPASPGGCKRGIDAGARPVRRCSSTARTTSSRPPARTSSCVVLEAFVDAVERCADGDRGRARPALRPARAAPRSRPTAAGSWSTAGSSGDALEGGRSRPSTSSAPSCARTPRARRRVRRAGDRARRRARSLSAERVAGVRTRLPRAERERQMLDDRARAVRRARLRGRDDGRGRGRRRRHEAAALQLLRQQGAAVPGVHEAGRGRAGARPSSSAVAATRRTPPSALRAGIHAFFALPRRRRRGVAGAARRDAARRRRDRRARRRVPRRGWRRSSPPRCRSAPESRAVEPLSVAIFGAAEALGRWWLRTGAIRAERTAELLIRTIEPGLRTTMRTDNRRVAVIGGNRIPFARSNGPYAHASNQDMLTATLDGLVDALRRCRASGSARWSAGAVLKHAATSTSRASACSARALAPETPAYDLQQACGTGLEAAIAGRQQDRARADRRRASPAASTPPPTRRSRVNEDLRQRAARRSTGPSRCRAALKLLDAAAPGPARARDPAQRRAAHRAVDGRARGAARPRDWGITREEQDELAARQPPATWPPPTTAASSTTSSRRTSGSSATRTCARTRRVGEAGQAQAGVRRRGRRR